VPEVEFARRMTIDCLRRIPVVLVACLAATGLAPQDWRARALESFDVAWQTIHDTYYDPAFGGVDWQAVRDEFRPRAAAAASQDEVRAVIREMLGRLAQSHFVLLSSTPSDALPGSAVVPIELRVSNGDAIVTAVRAGSSAARAGLRAGTRVLAIDGETHEVWIAGVQATSLRARDVEVWRRAFRALHGALGSVAQLRVRLPDGTEQTVGVARELEPGQVVTLGNLPPMHVRTDVRELRTPRGRRAGLIGFNVWMAAASPAIESGIDRFRADDGIIFDLRGNPGGLLLMIGGVAGHVMADASRPLGRMQTRQAPLVLAINPRLSTADGRRVEPYAGPVAVLVDELTGSASECFAGGLQSLGRARIFGRQSMGQVLPATTKKLPMGDVLMFAIGDFVTATGRRLEGAGVTPDEAQPLSISDLAAGRDAPLEAALAWIDSVRSSVEVAGSAVGVAGS
jgi:carboxyl-terminal processing protease